MAEADVPHTGDTAATVIQRDPSPTTAPLDGVARQVQVVQLVKEFTFEAAHRLPYVPPGHKCGRLHGHSFKVEVRVEGPINPATGWFVDYGDIKDVVKPIVDGKLDHNYLNEIQGLENPTSENIAVWLWDQLGRSLPGLVEIVVFETCSARCVYRGPAHGQSRF